MTSTNHKDSKYAFSENQWQPFFLSHAWSVEKVEVFFPFFNGVLLIWPHLIGD